MEKVSTEENLADALTKPLTNEGIIKHVQGSGYEMRQDRHRLVPNVEDEGGELDDDNGGDAAGDYEEDVCE